eukprot:scaffold626510_cov38-Prasinocladus_malaysianus.AAC.1
MGNIYSASPRSAASLTKLIREYMQLRMLWLWHGKSARNVLGIGYTTVRYSKDTASYYYTDEKRLM